MVALAEESIQDRFDFKKPEITDTISVQGNRNLCTSHSIALAFAG